MSSSRSVRRDSEGASWCVEHKCMMMPGPDLVDRCPFCWIMDRPQHIECGCTGCLARDAMQDGTAPWMSDHGKRVWKEVFGRAA